MEVWGRNTGQSKVGHVTKVEEISKKVHASRFKWYLLCNENRRSICG